MTAMGTNNPIRPAHSGHKVNAHIRIGEIPHSSKQIGWQRVSCELLHADTMAQAAWCVKYILANFFGGLGVDVLWNQWGLLW